MQDGSDVSCIGNQQVVSCCIVYGCIHPAFLCQNNTCQCHLNHADCNLTIPFKNIRKKIEVNGLKYVPALEQLKRWYDATIKRLNNQSLQLSTIMDEPALTLQGDAGVFYSLLKQHRFNQIDSDLVLRVLNCLAQQYQIIPLEQSQSVQRQIVMQNQNIERILQNIREEWKCRIKVPFVPIQIDDCLKSKNIRIENKSFICSQNQYSQYYNVIYFKPTMQNSYKKSRKFQFKIKRLADNSYFFIGACRKEYIKNGLQSTIIHKQPNISYFMGGNGVTYYRKDKNHNTNFRINVEDIIRVTLNSARNVLIFQNQTKNLFNEVTVILQKGNELHLALLMYYPQDEVQYLGEISN